LKAGLGEAKDKISKGCCHPMGKGQLGCVVDPFHNDHFFHGVCDIENERDLLFRRVRPIVVIQHPSVACIPMVRCLSGELCEPPLETTRFVRPFEADFKLAFCDVKADSLNVPVVQPRPHIRQKVAEQNVRRSHNKYR